VTLRPSTDPADVTVVFTQKNPGDPWCPVGVTVAAGKECKVSPDKEPCLHPNRLDWVTFASDPVDKAFTIYFDPFKKGAMSSDKYGVLETRIAPAAPHKTYSYNVVAPNCPILDPTIIVQ
jgi:hypothetical protein